MALNSSFGNLITASALLDTKSTDSKIFLEELKKLRDGKPYTAYIKKNYGEVTDDAMTELIKLTTDAVIRDYTMLLMFEKIAKLACEFQKYTEGKDNCNLPQLQRNITDAKKLLETQKFAKPQ
ncbi:MAG: hypothetical protein K0U45_03535 [Alphaproteobacteria bacterium]|nr:hypothetical protein [Alphaproteobacteria bacterium]